MDNYHYIVASLPVMSPDYSFGSDTPESLIGEITEQCSGKDLEVIGFLMKGFDSESLDCGFYREALTHRNRFIREYFAFDLNLRNARVRYLNRQLGRPSEKDVMDINADEDAPRIETGDFEESGRVEEILSGSDLLERERGLDRLVWDKVDTLTTFDWFDLETILGFICRLQISARWYRLDAKTGKEMFRRLVEEIRGTFQGVHYEE